MSKLYIAYGSNLNMEQMAIRCPTAEFIGAGVIENYELQFKGSFYGACATIAPKEGSSVPVGVWKIQKQDEMRLDRYEGYPNIYFKQKIPVAMGRETITGMVYIMDPRMDFGNPSQHYYDTVYQGYIDCGLDTDVLNDAVEASMDMAKLRMQQGGMRFC